MLKIAKTMGGVALTAVLLLGSSAKASMDIQAPTTTTINVQIGGRSFTVINGASNALMQAKTAALITVKSVHTPNDEAAAIYRASIVRGYLMELGIAPQKININYSPIDRKAVKGADRVAIELIHLPGVDLAKQQDVQEEVIAEIPPKNSIRPRQFEFLPEDGNLKYAVQRWAHENNYDLIWELSDDVNPNIIKYKKLDASDIKSALNQVLSGLRARGYPINIFIYSDGVIRFTDSGQ